MISRDKQMTEPNVVCSHPTWIGTGVKAKIAFHAFVLRSISRVGVLVIEIKSVPTPCIFQVKLTPHLKLPIMRLVKKIVVRLSYGLRDCSVPLSPRGGSVCHIRADDRCDDSVLHIQSFNEEVLFLQHEVWHDIYPFCIGMTSVEIKRLYPLLVLIKGTF